MAKHHLQMRQWSFDSLAEFLPPPRFASFWERDLPNLQQFCKTKWKQLEPFPGISLRFWSFPCSTWVWQLSSSVILTSVWAPSHIRFLQTMRIVCIITCKNFSRESGVWRLAFSSPFPLPSPSAAHYASALFSLLGWLERQSYAGYHPPWPASPKKPV